MNAEVIEGPPDEIAADDGRPAARPSGMTSALQNIVVHFLVIAIQIATGIITGRVLGPTGKGEQAAMILWPVTLSHAMLMGLPSSIVYNLKKYPAERSALLPAALLLGGALGLLAALLGAALIPRWMALYPPDVVRHARWFMLYTPVLMLSLISIATLRAEEDFARANKSFFLTSLVMLVGLGLLALTGRMTPLTAGLTYLMGGAPMFGWMLARLWRSFRPRLRHVGESCRRLLRYGVRSYGIDLLGIFSTQIGQFLVVGFLTPAAMGLYVVAFSLSRMLDAFQNGVASVLFPKVANCPPIEVVDVTGLAARVTVAMTLPVGVAVAALSPLLLRLLYGAEYVGAVGVLGLLLIEVSISGAVAILAQAFMALGRPGLVTVLQAVGVGASLPLMLILVPRYGIVGAGLALLCSSTLRLIFVLVSFRAVLKLGPPSLILTRADVALLRRRLPALNFRGRRLI